MRLKQTVSQLTRWISLSARIGLCAGFGIALLILTYGPRMNGWIGLLLCPTSIVGFGLDSAQSDFEVWMGISIILLGNAIWYAVLFELAKRFIRGGR
jgi:hypothetical protein